MTLGSSMDAGADLRHAGCASHGHGRRLRRPLLQRGREYRPLAYIRHHPGPRLCVCRRQSVCLSRCHRHPAASCTESFGLVGLSVALPEAPHRVKPRTASSPAPPQAPHHFKPRATSPGPHIANWPSLGSASFFHIYYCYFFSFLLSMSFKFRIMINRIDCVSF
jgi:hypothetical protein